jgi:hypothetical protein
MDLGGLPVHHGLVTMAGLGLTGATSFGRSDRWNLAAGERKWRGGGARDPHYGYKRAARWRSRLGDGGPRWWPKFLDEAATRARRGKYGGGTS